MDCTSRKAEQDDAREVLYLMLENVPCPVEQAYGSFQEVRWRKEVVRLGVRLCGTLGTYVLIPKASAASLWTVCTQ